MSYKNFNFIYKIIILFFVFCNNPSFGQWAYPSYNIQAGHYDNCSSDQMNFHIPGVITNQEDDYNTIINLNLLPSKIQSKLHIELTPGIEISANCSPSQTQSTELSINTSRICPTTILNSSDGTIPLYDKIEIGICPPDNYISAINNFLNNLSGSKINPYNPDNSDPDYISVQATFLSPSGIPHVVYGFYYREYNEDFTSDLWNEIPTEYPFRVRYMPDETGIWNVKIEIFSNLSNTSLDYGLDQTCSVTYNSRPSEFMCTPSSEKGLLEVGLHNTTLRYSNPNHESFFAIAYDVAVPYNLVGATQWNTYPRVHQITAQKNWIDQANSNGANYFRVSTWPEALGIEFEQLGVYDKFYDGTTLRNRQEYAWEMDRIVDLAKNKNSFLQVVLPTEPSNAGIGFWGWQNDCYNTITSINGNIDNFYTDQTVKKYIRQRLRYTIARWGYSSHIGDFEIANEIDHQDNYTNNKPAIRNFMLDCAQYLKDDLNDQHLHSVSYATTPDHPVTPFASNYTGTVFNNSYISISDIHEYGNNKNVNSYKRAGAFTWMRQFGKPGMMGEMGFYWDEGQTTDPSIFERCNDNSFHNAIWSTAFMGGMGCGANWWWWNAVSINHFDRNFVELATFMHQIDFESNNFSPDRWDDANFLQWQHDCNGDLIHKNQKLENYYLTNFSKTLCIGWFHNASWFWYNLSSLYSCVATLPAPCDDDVYTHPVVAAVSTIHIANLKWPLKTYYYDIYKTQGGILNDLSSMFSRNGHKRTNLVGTLKLNVHNDLLIHPDWAYQVYRTGFNFREDDTSLDSSEDDDSGFDTLCVGEHVFVQADYEDDSLGINNYSWDFGNGVTSNLEHPDFFYTSSGNYIITVRVTDSTGLLLDSAGMIYTVIDCGNDSNDDGNNERLSLEVDNHNQNQSNTSFFVIPTMSGGIFNIENTGLISFDYSIFNITGENILHEESNTEEKKQINISSKPPGLYFVKIITANSTSCFKIIKN